MEEVEELKPRLRVGDNQARDKRSFPREKGRHDATCVVALERCCRTQKCEGRKRRGQNVLAYLHGLIC